MLVLALLALAVAFHVGMLWNTVSGRPMRLYHDAWQRPGPGADFYAIYHAGHQVRAGRDPYAYAPERRPPDMPMFAPFRYLPGVASTLGVAVSHLPPRTAYLLWLGVLELVLVIDLALLVRTLPARRFAPVACAGWLFFTPLPLEAWMGQFTLVMASLLWWSVLAWEAGRRRLAALAWGAASLLKLIGFALVPWLARRRQLLTLGLGTLVLGWSAVWFVQHPDSWRTFAQANLGFHEIDLHEFHAGNLGLQGLLFHLALLFGVPSVETWRVVALVLPVALGGLAVWAMLVSPSPRTGVVLVLLLLPLGFKHVWEHHYVALLPAMSLLLDSWWGQRRRLLLLAVCFVVLALPTPFFLQPGTPGTNPELTWPVQLRLLHHAPKPLAALTLFLTLVHDAHTPKSTS